MLERFTDFILSILSLFQFWVIADEYEKGIVLRLGKLHKEIDPGFHWKLPLNIDDAILDNTSIQTTNLNSQSITTKDGQAIVLSTVLTWKIKDIKKYLIDVEEPDEALSDLTYGMVGEYVQNTNWNKINTQAFQQSVHDEIKPKARKYGIEVLSLRFADLTKTKTLRLINE